MRETILTCDHCKKEIARGRSVQAPFAVCGQLFAKEAPAEEGRPDGCLIVDLADWVAAEDGESRARAHPPVAGVRAAAVAEVCSKECLRAFVLAAIDDKLMPRTTTTEPP